MRLIEYKINEYLLWNGDPTTEPEDDVYNIIENDEIDQEMWRDERL